MYDLNLKPIYLNKQKYMECQLVSAINASIFLGLGSVQQYSNEYERLVDLVGARYGSAIEVKKAHEYLGLGCRPLERKEISFQRVKQLLEDGHPIELGIHHKKIGNHSVLLVSSTWGNKKYVKVCNFSEETDENGWIGWTRFYRYFRKIPNGLLRPAGYFYNLRRDSYFYSVGSSTKNGASNV